MDIRFATMTGLVLASFCGASLSGQGDCFSPGPCEDFDGNGVTDACQNVATLGNGLIGMYYRSCDSAPPGGEYRLQYLLSKIDANIDFESDPDFPPAGVPSDHFVVRWTGTLTSDETGTHELRARSDDGFRLMINGEYVIEEWTDSSGSDQLLATIELEAGVPVMILADYYENGGSDFCEIKWRKPSAGEDDDYVAIPSSAFAPSTDIDGDGYPDHDVEDCNGDGMSDAVEIGTGLAQDCDGNCVPDDCDPFEPDVLAWYRFQSNPLLVIDSSGNDRHLISSDDIVFSADRAVSTIPRTGEPNFGSAAFRNSGHLRYPDPDGVFAIGDQSFTVEAWIRIDGEGSTDSADQRQYLLQKKNASGDVNAGFQILAQCGNIAAAGNWYGKPGNRGGNELAIRFGNGSISYTLISRLQLLECAGWQHMSIAVDQENQRVRFEVNGDIEWQDLPGLGHVPGQGALRIGAHSTSSGAIDQEFDGNIDELRLIRGVLPMHAMLDRTTSVEDCPPAEDCSGDYDENGSIDGADLSRLLGSWGTDDPVVDLDGQPGVDGADLAFLLGVWGACP